MKRTLWMTTVALMAGLATAEHAHAQQFIYPSKGQSAETQKNDEAACYSWAVQQSGYDPVNAMSQTQPMAPAGAARGSGMRGAVGGAVIGGVIGDDAKGAAIGAATGAVGGRMISRRGNAMAAQKTQQQAQAAASQNQATFIRARTACLEGRGYTVK
ncbi:MAG: glycine zipper family protein [Rickettsiales bacterium]